MFDFLKKAFSKPEGEPAPTVAAPSKPAAPQPAPATQPAPAPKPVPAPTPAAQPAPAPKPVAAAPAPAQPAASGDTIQLAIVDIVAKLPAELAPLPGAKAGGSVTLPVSTVLSQLAAGSVKIRFAQIRDAAPAGTFPTDPALGETMIDLPLPKILALVNPALLTRRAGQKQIEVPAEITGVFGPKDKAGAPAPAAQVVSKPVPAAPVAAPTPVAPTPTPAPTPVVAPTPVIPIAPAAAPTPTPIAQKPPTSIASPPSAPKAPASTPLPFATQKPSAPPAAPAPMPFVTQKPAAPAAKPAAPAPAPAPAAAPASGGLVIKLSAISESWPEAVRQEITANNLTGASVALPLNRVDTGMKSGRVVFTWGELAQWLDGGSAPVASPNKETSLELPLKVIIPLFMAQRQTPTAQKKVVIGENIPNLFEGLVAAPAAAPAPTASTEVIPDAVTAVTIPDPVTAVTVPAPAPAPASVLGEIFGQPAKKEWSPQEIADKLKTLPGISAALIAMTDGLLVAGELPPPLKSETLAAFLPQMFGRMNHYSTETQLGSINALIMHAGQSQCAIYKAGTLFLAVLGKPGESLPDAVVQRVIGELAKRT